MASNKNFGRQYRLACGPAGGEGFEIGEVTAETPVPLHIAFSLQKSDLTTQNTGKVTVWNMNKIHRSVLEQDDCVLSLRAGYGSRLNLIFAGIVSFVSTVMEGADRMTEIELVDNLIQLRDTYVSISYRGKVNWKIIVEDVAAQMGVVVSYSYNAEFVDIPNGYSYVGKAKNILDKACDCCGLTWSVQNGVLQIKKPGDVMNREVYVLSAETGMIGSPERVVVSDSDGTGKKQLGWDVEYLLNGAINIDDFVKLESQNVSGYFRVYSLQMQGDNISGDWLCKARLLEVK